ncbi:MAG: FHA domain-containing protein [Pseudomonadota bacterium]
MTNSADASADAILMAMPATFAEDPIRLVTAFFSWCHKETTQLVFGAYTDQPELVIALGLAVAVPLLVGVSAYLPTNTTAKKRTDIVPLSRDGSGDDETGVNVSETSGVLRYRLGNEPGRQIGLRALRIGAAADCHFVIDGDDVADLHAIVVGDHNGRINLVRIAPNTALGIYVDGELSVARILRGGETIKIGRHLFSFETSCHGLDPMNRQSTEKAKVIGEQNHRASGGRAWAVQTSSGAKAAAGKVAGRY